MTSKQLIDAAKQVQEETKASTQRTRQVLDQTIEIGQVTSVTLKEQSEQLGRVDDQLDVLESNLKRADKQIRIFLRRMATDRMILSIVAMVVFALIAAVAVAVINARKEGKTVCQCKMCAD